MTERWVTAAQLRAFLHAVKAEADRRQFTADAKPGFARWLEWAEGYVQAVDPLAPGRKLPVY